MRLSKYFVPTLKDDPKDAEIISHKLMIRTGMVRQISSGLYSWLPMGFKVLKKIENIIAEEMDKAGCFQVITPMIQPKSLWLESGRYDSYGKEMLRILDRHNNDMLYAPTAEEVICDLFRKNVTSYKSLPLNIYQIQWKFRDEIRPRHGVMRAREFLMKDGYSFDLDEKSARETYENMFQAYMRIFKRIGLKTVAIAADNGEIGGSLSHEFFVITENGESEIKYNSKLESMMDSPADEYFAVDNSEGKTCRGIEVGHIFNFDTKYSKSMNAKITRRDGKEIFPSMGSYGIGVSRLVAAIIEASSDEKGIIWPKSVAPFDIGLINLHSNNEKCVAIAEEIYASINSEILYDDTQNSTGQKFSQMDLIGTPIQIIIGPKMVEEGNCEVKIRKTGEVKVIKLTELVNFLK